MKHQLPTLEQLLQKASGKDLQSSQRRENHSYISIDTPLSEVIPLFLECEQIVVTDATLEPVGSLQQAQVLQAMYQAFQYLDAYFKTLIETLDLSVSVIDEQANVVVWSEMAEQLFSIPASDMLDKPITDFFTVDMLAMLKTLQTGEAVYRQHHQPREDLIVLINTKPVMLNGKIVGSVAAEADITSQVRLHQELHDATQKVLHLEQKMAKLSPSTDPFQQIKGKSKAIKRLKNMITMLATTKTSVLILGENGVGKELFAHSVHNIREARDAPFVEINCGAIAPTLFESELFGYEKGAFSGADQKGKKGMVELARGGTLFLDEIGEMPLDMQVKLLRVLQEKAYYPLGGTKKIEVDFCVIAATNRDLEAMIAEGKFREDLYYRLNVFSLLVPPLRERREDIIELAQFFLDEFSLRYHRPIYAISPILMDHLLDYHWPGNIRELRNMMERLVVFSTDGMINEELLPFSQPVKTRKSPPVLEVVEHSLREEQDQLDRKIIQQALALEKGNKQAAAKRLGISRKTLYNKMNKLRIPIK
ncbi:sigma-54-dependent Fis family transcriptional regulator [Brevibacillus reuszeri]|uniref:Sigma-54-dependent Fis family transcriptional regulator n=1 Tax=Brevibacillus reuszeri TaxID=54915 RepID=A0ABQ0TVD8_9BACL|nr:sigma-54-dependent Fis family transcriptional regulator [Brevibacillus reuszeri]MED1860212.1 sigma-54-dependent Fis family transcriptional regulator [Brevibacillus reuszeri]GED71589.1 sigma-54-dependent Fis family transcriptional regulator [Brevibacillus reuszeri]